MSPAKLADEFSVPGGSCRDGFWRASPHRAPGRAPGHLTAPFKPWLLWSVLLLGGLWPEFGAAVVLFNNLDRNPYYITLSTDKAWSAQQIAAMPQSYTLTSVSLLMRRESGTGAAVVRIFSDNAGQPGAPIGIMTSPGSYSGTLALTLFTAAGITLEAHKRYWVVLSSADVATTFAWSFTDNATGAGDGFSSEWRDSSNSGASWSGSGAYPYRMTVEGLPGPVVLSNFNAPLWGGTSFNLASLELVGLGFSTGPGGYRISGLSLSLLSGPSNTIQKIRFLAMLYAADPATNLPTGLPLDQGQLYAEWTNPVGGGVRQQQTFTYNLGQRVRLSPNSKYVLVLAASVGASPFDVGPPETYWAVTGGDYAYAASEGFAFTTMSRSLDFGHNWFGTPAFRPIAAISVTVDPCGPGLSLTTGAGALWQQLALPCVPDTATVQGALGSGGDGNLLACSYNSGGGNYKNKTDWWNLYRYDASTPAYVLPSLGDAVSVGTGYWLKSFDAPAGGGKLTVTGTATPTDVVQADGCAVANCKAIPLTVAANRYNLVGNPFPYNVDWSKVRVRVKNGATLVGVYTPSQAETPANVLSKQIWIWNGTTYETWDDDTNKGNLKYLQSFWVKVLPGAVGKTIELLIPAEASTLSQAAPTGLPWYLAWLDVLVPPAQAADSEWQVRLQVENKVTGWKDTTNLLGQKATAQTGYDRHDLLGMPPFATPYLSLVFPHADWPTLNGQKRAGDYDTDFRPAAGNRPTDWAFELRGSPTGGKVWITWQADPAILQRSRLVDLQTGAVIDPRAVRYAQSYPVALKASPQRYQWRYLGR
ncbi:MAG: choice-of-anchor R domain-containing protein [Methylococcus sp.]